MEARVKSTMVLAAVAVAAVGATACFMPGLAGPVVNEQHAVERGAATAAKIDIDMSAGDLDVTSGAAKLFEGDFAFNTPALKPDIQYAVNGATGTLRVSQGSSSGNVENR